MLLIAETIRARGLIVPCEDRHVVGGLSAGLSLAGYDVTSAPVNGVRRLAPQEGRLFAVGEELRLPRDVLVRVCDKSSWARRGVYVGNLVAEPGWTGFLTIRLTNHSDAEVEIVPGMPIAQLLFEQLEREAQPYDGKYQRQPQVPTGVRYEREGAAPTDRPGAA